MVRRPCFWAAVLAFALCLVSGARPATSDPGTVAWILLGGKGKAAKVSGLQLYAEPALDHSILYRLNTVVWANGFIVSDEECPEEHFHGRAADLQDRGNACGLGKVRKYADSPEPIQHASDALMSNLAAGYQLANVRFTPAAAAAETSLQQLLALKASLQTADPQQFPTRRLALPSVNEAILRQTDARDILIRLSTQTSNRFAIRRAEQALRKSAKITRRAFTLLAAGL
jgi:hypothetical protein